MDQQWLFWHGLVDRNPRKAYAWPDLRWSLVPAKRRRIAVMEDTARYRECSQRAVDCGADCQRGARPPRHFPPLGRRATL